MEEVSHQSHHHQTEYLTEIEHLVHHTDHYHMLHDLCLLFLTCKLSLVWLIGGVSLLSLDAKAVRSGRRLYRGSKGRTQVQGLGPKSAKKHILAGKKIVGASAFGFALAPKPPQTPPMFIQF